MLNSSSIDRLNTTVAPHIHVHIQHAHNQLNEPLLILLCVLAVIENLLVCYMICAYRQLRKATNIFIVGLCITNVLCGGVLLPIDRFYPDSPEKNFFIIIIILIYICNLTAVTNERFIAITYPLRYHQLITKKNAIRITIVCYIIPVLYGILPTAWHANTNCIEHKVYITVTLILFFLAPLIFILGVYGKVLLATHRLFQRHRKYVVKRKNSTSEIWAEAKFMCCFGKSDVHEENNSFIKHVNADSSSILSNKSNRSLRTFENVTKVESSPHIVNDVIHEEINDQDWLQSKPVHKKEERSRRRTLPSRISMSTMKSNEFELHRISDDKRKQLKSRYSENTILTVFSTKQPLKNSRSTGEIGRKYPFPSSINVEDSSQPRRKSLPRYPRRRSSTMRSSTRSWLNFNAKAKQTLTELKASLAFAMVALTYMFTWIPVMYMTFLQVIDKSELIPPSLSLVSTYTIGLNAMLDPLLYFILVREFRVTMKRIIRRRIMRNG